MIKQSLLELFRVVGPGAPARYISDTETLRLTVFNSASGVRVALRGRKIDENGESRFASNEVVPNTSRTASIVDVQPGAGWLVGCSAMIVAGTPQDGQTYAVLSIGVGDGAKFTETEVLAADTITNIVRVSWPGSGIIGPLDSAGAVRVIAGATPAAGAEFSETVPTGARWELVSLRARLTTGVAVANRVPDLVLDDGANVFYLVGTNVSETASLAKGYCWAQGVGAHDNDNNTNIGEPLPSNNRLSAGFRIRSANSNLQAADQWDQLFYEVKEWPEGN